MNRKEKSSIPRVNFFKRNEFEFQTLPLEDLLLRSNRQKPPLVNPHRVQFYNVIYITSGRGTHHIDFLPHKFDQGSLIFISRDQVHSFDLQPGIKGYVILFTEDFIEKNLIHSEVLSLYRLYNHHLHNPVIESHVTQTENFHELFTIIWKEYSSLNTFGQEEILRLYLKTLLLKTERIKRTPTKIYEKN